jgi:hypothetical protein
MEPETSKPNGEFTAGEIDLSIAWIQHNILLPKMKNSMVMSLRQVKGSLDERIVPPIEIQPQIDHLADLAFSLNDDENQAMIERTLLMLISLRTQKSESHE